MEKNKKIALFDHHGCQSKFFARLETSQPSKYKGRCPNPKCNRTVTLMPEELFTSMDKARREYIRLSSHRDIRIYWHT